MSYEVTRTRKRRNLNAKDYAGVSGQPPRGVLAFDKEIGRICSHILVLFL
jgi:hypothetical protein